MKRATHLTLSVDAVEAASSLMTRKTGSRPRSIFSFKLSDGR